MATPQNIFDFEQPIYDLQAKLDEMAALAEETGIGMEQERAKLEDKIQELRENVYNNLSRWQRVQISRHPDRPYSLDYINAIATDFQELYGDRQFRDDKAMVGGLGKIAGQTVMFIGQQKGRTTKDRQYRNFGMPNPEGYRKALRLMQMAEKFDIPVVCLIDTPGAFPGIEAEERGQGEAIARNLREMAVLRVPVICVVIGEGASGGALGIGVGDRIHMLENTWYSVISPESCSSILWHTWEKKEQAAEALRLTAEDNYRLGLIDSIIEEPLGGAHYDPQTAFQNVRDAILDGLEELKPLDADTRIAQRIDKFMKMGVVQEA